MNWISTGLPSSGIILSDREINFCSIQATVILEFGYMLLVQNLFDILLQSKDYYINTEKATNKSVEQNLKIQKYIQVFMGI